MCRLEVDLAALGGAGEGGPRGDGLEGFADALAAVAPLAMVGLWQAGVVRLLRERNAARRHAAGAAGPTASEDHDAVGPNDPAGAE